MKAKGRATRARGPPAWYVADSVHPPATVGKSVTVPHRYVTVPLHGCSWAPRAQRRTGPRNIAGQEIGAGMSVVDGMCSQVRPGFSGNG